MRVFLVGFLELGRFPDRILQLDIERRGYHLGDAIDVAVRHVHGPTDVLDRRLRRHGAERDDLRDVLAAVLSRDIFDHLAATVHAEIDVDVGHRNAFGIQEALKEQFVLQRIDVGDLERIGHQRARGRAAPRPHRNVMLFGVADEVPHDQEVSGKLHLLDNGDFARQPLLVVRQAVLEFSLPFQFAQNV